MKQVLFIISMLWAGVSLIAQSEVVNLLPFTDVRIGQHIEAELIEGKTNSIEIIRTNLPDDKIIIDDSNGKLEIYLEGARFITKNKKEKRNHYKMREPVYAGTQVKIRITYKKLEKLAVMGEERTTFLSDLVANDFKLNLYGSGLVSFKGFEVSKLDVDVYGEYDLKFEEGAVSDAKFTIYGESDWDLLSLECDRLRATIYGSASLRVHVEDQIKVSGFGEYHVEYKGRPEVIRKGITLGEGRVVAL